MPEIVGNFLKRLLHAWLGFLSSFGVVIDDFRRIRKGRKSAVLMKARLLSIVLDMADLEVPEIVPNSMKRLLHACKWISKCLRCF